MRSRTNVLMLGACLAAASVFVVVVLSEAEPRYAHRSLSEWIEMWFQAQQTQDKSKMDEAAEGIRHIGTNAIPILLVHLSRQPVSYKTGLYERLEKQGVRNEALFNIAYSEEKKAAEVEWIFGVLGPIAKPAIPQLREFALNSTNDTLRERAIFSLIGIGDDSLPFFKEALSDVNHPSCTAVAFCLSVRQSTNFHSFTDLVPYFVKLSTTTNAVALHAAKALSAIEANQRLTIE